MNRYCFSREKTFLVLVVTCLLCGRAFPAQDSEAHDQQPTINFVCGFRPNEAPYEHTFKHLSNVFNQLGYRYVQRHVEISEALTLLKAGEVDGDCARLDGFLEVSGLNGYVSIGPTVLNGSFSRWFIRDDFPDRKSTVVGYNSNALMLTVYLKKMGYRKLIPFSKSGPLIEALLDGSIDMAVDYEQSMDQVRVDELPSGIQRGKHFMTLPVKPYIRQSLADKLEEHWPQAYETVQPSSWDKEIPEKNRGTMVFSCSLDKKVKLYRYFDHLYSEAFKKLGYQFRMISLPRARETHELSLGRIDGSCGRTKFVGEQHENVLQVNESVLQIEMRVWSHLPSEELTSLADIPASATLAMVRGTTYLENKLSNYKGKLVYIPTIGAGLKMLAAERVEFLMGFESGVQTLVENAAVEIPIYNVLTFESLELYPYLSQDHEGLVDELGAVLKEIAVQYQ